MDNKQKNKLKLKSQIVEIENEISLIMSCIKIIDKDIINIEDELNFDKRKIWTNSVKSVNTFNDLLKKIAFIQSDKIYSWINDIEKVLISSRIKIDNFNKTELIENGKKIDLFLETKESKKNKLIEELNEIENNNFHPLIYLWAENVRDIFTDTYYQKLLNYNRFFSFIKKDIITANLFLDRIEFLMKEKHPFWNGYVDDINPSEILKQKLENEKLSNNIKYEIEKLDKIEKDYKIELNDIVLKLKEHKDLINFVENNDNEVSKIISLKKHYDSSILNPYDVLKYGEIFNDQNFSFLYQLKYSKYEILIHIKNSILKDLNSLKDIIEYINKSNKENANLIIINENLIDKDLNLFLRLRKLRTEWFISFRNFILNYEINDKKNYNNVFNIKNKIIKDATFNEKIEQSGALFIFENEMIGYNKIEKEISIYRLSFNDLMYITQNNFNLSSYSLEQIEKNIINNFKKHYIIHN